jgi:ubiquinone/menaquinone biosynthesis C-methylase UbiE
MRNAERCGDNGPMTPSGPAAAPRFDYDEGEIHRVYSAGRALSPVQTTFWSAVLREELETTAVRRVLDLGCGVGRFSRLLRETFGARVHGVDRSAKMLAVAAANPELAGIRFVRATAEALPFRAGGVDLVFVFLVYHHLVDPAAALRECARVIGARGAVVVVNTTVELLDSLVWLSFFPTAQRIDRERMPSRAALARAARDAGLEVARRRTVMNPVARDLRAYADRLASRTVSTLQMVSDAEFTRGMAEFRRYCEREDRGEVVVNAIDVFVLAAPPRRA